MITKLYYLAEHEGIVSGPYGTMTQAALTLAKVHPLKQSFTKIVAQKVELEQV